MAHKALEVIAKIDFLMTIIESNRGNLAQCFPVRQDGLNQLNGPDGSLKILANLRARLMEDTMEYNKTLLNAADTFQVLAGMVHKALRPTNNNIGALLAMDFSTTEIPPISSSSIDSTFTFDPALAFPVPTHASPRPATPTPSPGTASTAPTKPA